MQTALTAAQVGALADGTAPGAITGNPGLLAHWNFDDASTGGPTPTIGIARDAANVTITYTGSLESADNITGPWAPVAGTSPATVPATGAGKFYRASQAP